MPLERRADETLDLKKHGKRHVIYSGTTIIQSEGPSVPPPVAAAAPLFQNVLPLSSFRGGTNINKDRGDNSSVQTPTFLSPAIGKSGFLKSNGGAIAYVMKTGGNTYKGAMTRKIMYPTTVKYKFEDNMYVLLIGTVVVLMLLMLVPGIVKGAATPRMFYQYLVDGLYDSFLLAFLVINPGVLVGLIVAQSSAAARMELKSVFGIRTLEFNRLVMAGELSIQCLDKTGTITEEGLRLSAVQGVSEGGSSVEVLGERDARLGLQVYNDSSKRTLFEIGLSTCHTVQQDAETGELQGNAVEVEMVNFAHGDQLQFRKGETAGTNGIEYYDEKTGSQHFQSVRQFEFDASVQLQSVLVEQSASAKDNAFVVFTKGSFESVSKRCKPDTIPATAGALAKEKALQGFYVLSMATRRYDAPSRQYAVEKVTRQELEQDLTFLGFLHFRNEIKPDSAAALAELRNANIRLVMITGDNLWTGVQVGLRSGLVPGNAVILAADLVSNAAADRATVAATGRATTQQQLGGRKRTRDVASPPPQMLQSLRESHYDEWVGSGAPEVDVDPLRDSQAQRPALASGLESYAESEARVSRPKPSLSRLLSDIPQTVLHWNYIQREDEKYADDFAALIRPSGSSAYRPKLGYVGDGPEVHRPVPRVDAARVLGGGLHDRTPATGRVKQEGKQIVVAVSEAALLFLKAEDQDLADFLHDKIAVYGRATPGGKVSVVRSMQAGGNIVGMCGDGGNDAPALRAAHAGMALSGGEKSMVGSFVSPSSSLFGLSELVRQGRCCVVTSVSVMQVAILCGVVGLIFRLIVTLMGGCMGFYDQILAEILLGTVFAVVVTVNVSPAATARILLKKYHRSDAKPDSKSSCSTCCGGRNSKRDDNMQSKEHEPTEHEKEEEERGKALERAKLQPGVVLSSSRPNGDLLSCTKVTTLVSIAVALAIFAAAICVMHRSQSWSQIRSLYELRLEQQTNYFRGNMFPVGLAFWFYMTSMFVLVTTLSFDALRYRTWFFKTISWWFYAAFCFAVLAIYFTANNWYNGWFNKFIDNKHAWQYIEENPGKWLKSMLPVDVDVRAEFHWFLRRDPEQAFTVDPSALIYTVTQPLQPPMPGNDNRSSFAQTSPHHGPAAAFLEREGEELLFATDADDPTAEQADWSHWSSTSYATSSSPEGAGRDRMQAQILSAGSSSSFIQRRKRNKVKIAVDEDPSPAPTGPPLPRPVNNGESRVADYEGAAVDFASQDMAAKASQLLGQFYAAAAKVGLKPPPSASPEEHHTLVAQIHSYRDPDNSNTRPGAVSVMLPKVDELLFSPANGTLDVWAQNKPDLVYHFCQELCEASWKAGEDAYNAGIAKNRFYCWYVAVSMVPGSDSMSCLLVPRLAQQRPLGPELEPYVRSVLKPTGQWNLEAPHKYDATVPLPSYDPLIIRPANATLVTEATPSWTVFYVNRHNVIGWYSMTTLGERAPGSSTVDQGCCGDETQEGTANVNPSGVLDRSLTNTGYAPTPDYYPRDDFQVEDVDWYPQAYSNYPSAWHTPNDYVVYMMGCTAGLYIAIVLILMLQLILEK
ncbi:unnamed protein product [Amoebophrya sp. A120]|nr:unnamed protein product [Amoebophrya sp. A120]|eukprot:GSA120T00018579001.1